MTAVILPGVYDLPAEVYHADPVPGGSLSSSGARLLLPPNCPAMFRYERDHPSPPRRVFEIGHAAHKLVLGVGPTLVRIDAEEWRSNAAKADVAAARNAGAVPLRPSEWDQVHEMAAALRAHPVASALFDPASGKPERSFFWIDKATEVWRRAMLDWVPEGAADRMILADYKTCVKADPEEIARAVASHGYHQQAAWNLDAVAALREDGRGAAFLFVCQEKTPPYLVTVVELNAVALRIARELNREAIDVYARCMAEDRWPGYSDEVELVALPPWVEARHPEGARV